MKLTKSKLQQIIKEELGHQLNTEEQLTENYRSKATSILDQLVSMNISPNKILRLIMNNFLADGEAYEAMLYVAEDMGLDPDDLV